MCADQAKCADIHFCCEASHFPDCAEGSEEKHGNITGKLLTKNTYITGKTASAVLCGSWRC